MEMKKEKQKQNKGAASHVQEMGIAGIQPRLFEDDSPAMLKQATALDLTNINRRRRERGDRRVRPESLAGNCLADVLTDEDGTVAVVHQNSRNKV
jgi:hypothetical protein